jgi:hypothetical protein
MTRKRVNPALAWLCLIWFGLTNTLFASGMVVCHDGHGGSRIEWGCERNATGECFTRCGDDGAVEDGSVPHPCEDTPLLSDHQVTKAPPRSAAEVGIPIPLMVAVLVFWAVEPPPTAVLLSGSEPQRPPDALKCIRTVVLLV